MSLATTIGGTRGVRESRRRIPPARLELATCALGKRRSIQLSYGGSVARCYASPRPRQGELLPDLDRRPLDQQVRRRRGRAEQDQVQWPPSSPHAQEQLLPEVDRVRQQA